MPAARNILFLALFFECISAFNALPVVPSTKAPSRSVPLYSSAALGNSDGKAVGGVTTIKGGASDDGSALLPSTFNLIKNIVGAGVLALPGGIAAFSDSKAAVVPAFGLVGALGLLSAYCFSLIGRLCVMTGTTTYKAAVTKVLGEFNGKILSTACTTKTGFACLMYSIIIGDTSHALASTFGLIDAVPMLAQRWKMLAVSTIFTLLPLCLMRSFAILSYTSLLGILGTLYTGVFMGIRLFDGSYAPGGQFYGSLSALPKFGTTTSPAAAFILVSMLSTAYIAHYNAPRFYTNLKDRSVKKFNVLTAAGFGASIAIMGTMMAMGFLTFGAASSGFVLNNYASGDALATVARVAILASIIFGYPLTFVGFRDGALEVAGVGGKDGQVSQKTKDISTVLGLAFFTVAGTFIRNLGLVSSVGGALLGSAIIYIFPALSYIKAVGMGLTDDGKAVGTGIYTKNESAMEVLVNKFIAVLGVFLAVVGVTVSLK